MLAAAGWAAETLSKGHVVLDADFEAASADAAWVGDRRYEAGCESPRSLCVDNRTGSGRPTIHVRLPAETLRGCTLRGSAMVKADGVSAKPNSWNGIKFMLAIETPDRKLWPQAALDTGTFDWKRAVFSTKIPADATAVTLVLGLEQVTGKVCFDDVKIVVAKPPTTAKPAPAPGIAFKGHDLPRLRGAMIGPHIDEDGLRTLGRDWNANLIRWQLIRHGRPGQPSSLADYDAWLEGELKRLDAALPLCQRYGIYVVVDLHSPPGGKSTVSGYVGSDDRLFTDRAVQDKFVEVWRGSPGATKTPSRSGVSIWPTSRSRSSSKKAATTGTIWRNAPRGPSARSIRSGRSSSKRRPGVRRTAWPTLRPSPCPNVVYSAHMYVPGQFTHQGVHQRNQPPVTYPGDIGGKHWDKAALQAALQPVIDFQRAYNVHIYIGEFSAIRWAPGDSACRYLRDVIEIFEQHGWDWSYHAFREWNGWSVEHGPDRNDTQPAAQPTDRQLLLREWFGKNQKPAWTRQE